MRLLALFAAFYLVVYGTAIGVYAHQQSKPKPEDKPVYTGKTGCTRSGYKTKRCT